MARPLKITKPGKSKLNEWIRDNSQCRIKWKLGNPDNCPVPDKFILGEHSTDDDIALQSKHSIVSSAFLSGLSVEFYVDGCHSIGQLIIIANVCISGLFSSTSKLVDGMFYCRVSTIIEKFLLPIIAYFSPVIAKLINQNE